MTYLQLVNRVLTRLREDSVDTVSQNTYSNLIGIFVNDAKRLVEQAWDWSTLRSVITVSTVADDYLYSLPNTNDSSEVMTVVNDTSNTFMQYATKDWFEKYLYTTNVLTGSPKYYTYAGLDANGDTQIMVYPKPDGVYNLRFTTAVRGDELVNDTDTTFLPFNPIVQFATGFAIAERGEAGGQSAQETLTVANRMLSDAIALDSARHPEELIYQAV